MTLICKRENFTFELREHMNHFHLTGVGLPNPSFHKIGCHDLGDDFVLSGSRDLLDVQYSWFLYEQEQVTFSTINSVQEFIQERLDQWERIKAGKEAANKILTNRHPLSELPGYLELKAKLEKDWSHTTNWATMPWIKESRSILEFFKKLEALCQNSTESVFAYLGDHDGAKKEEPHDMSKADNLSEFLDSIEYDAWENANAIFELENTVEGMADNIDGMATGLEKAEEDIQQLRESLVRLERRIRHMEDSPVPQGLISHDDELSNHSSRLDSIEKSLNSISNGHWNHIKMLHNTIKGLILRSEKQVSDETVSALSSRISKLETNQLNDVDRAYLDSLSKRIQTWEERLEKILEADTETFNTVEHLCDRVKSLEHSLKRPGRPSRKLDV